MRRVSTRSGFGVSTAWTALRSQTRRTSSSTPDELPPDRRRHAFGVHRNEARTTKSLRGGGPHAFGSGSRTPRTRSWPTCGKCTSKTKWSAPGSAHAASRTHRLKQQVTLHPKSVATTGTSRKSDGDNYVTSIVCPPAASTLARSGRAALAESTESLLVKDTAPSQLT